MRTVLCLIATALVGAIGLAGCESTSSAGRGALKPTLPPAARPSSAAGLSDEEIRQAVRLCAVKCARCHKLYDPAAYSEAEWKSWMAKMSKKARLKSDQEEMLTRYLNALRVRVD